MATAPITTVAPTPQVPGTAQTIAPSQTPASATAAASEQQAQPVAPRRPKQTVTWETVQEELAEFTALLTALEAKLPLPIREAH